MRPQITIPYFTSLTRFLYPTATLVLMVINVTVIYASTDSAGHHVTAMINYNVLQIVLSITEAVQEFAQMVITPVIMMKSLTARLEVVDYCILIAATLE